MRRPWIPLLAAIAALLITTSSARAEWTFVRGDANADGVVNFVDVIQVLNHLLVAGTEPSPCRDALDANDSGLLDIGDAVYLLEFIFEGSSVPSSPFPSCGADPTPDAIECAGPLNTCPQFLTTIGFSVASQQTTESSPSLTASSLSPTRSRSRSLSPTRSAETRLPGRTTCRSAA